jgi:hypothetical protein
MVCQTRVTIERQMPSKLMENGEDSYNNVLSILPMMSRWIKEH